MEHQLSLTIKLTPHTKHFPCFCNWMHSLLRQFRPNKNYWHSKNVDQIYIYLYIYIYFFRKFWNIWNFLNIRFVCLFPTTITSLQSSNQAFLNSWILAFLHYYNHAIWISCSFAFLHYCIHAFMHSFNLAFLQLFYCCNRTFL